MKTERYTSTAIALHWLIGLMILTSFAVGFYMSGLKFSPEKLKLYNWHKWAGITIFMLVLIRCLWRLTHAVPPPPANMPAWQHKVADATHYVLYALMIVIPLSGWLMSSAKGFQTVYLGILPLPDLLDKDKVLGDALSALHEVLNITLLVLVASHVAAALKHHFFDRDGTLARMIPFLNRSTRK